MFIRNFRHFKQRPTSTIKGITVKRRTLFTTTKGTSNNNSNTGSSTNNNSNTGSSTSTKWVSIPIYVGVVYIGLMQLYKVINYLTLISITLRLTSNLSLDFITKGRSVRSISNHSKITSPSQNILFPSSPLHFAMLGIHQQPNSACMAKISSIQDLFLLVWL